MAEFLVANTKKIRCNEYGNGRFLFIGPTDGGLFPGNRLFCLFFPGKDNSLKSSSSKLAIGIP
jgi:hypothetical protein